MQISSSLSLSLLHLLLLFSEDEKAQDEQNDSDDPVDVGAEEGTDELSWSEEVEQAADVKDSNSESDASRLKTVFFSITSWIFSRVHNIFSNTLPWELTKVKVSGAGGGYAGEKLGIFAGDTPVDG